MSDRDFENVSFVSVIFEEVCVQIRAVINPFMQQLAHLCKLMRELRNELSS